MQIYKIPELSSLLFGDGLVYLQLGCFSLLQGGLQCAYVPEVAQGRQTAPHMNHQLVHDITPCGWSAFRSWTSYSGIVGIDTPVQSMTSGDAADCHDVKNFCHRRAGEFLTTMLTSAVVS